MKTKLKKLKDYFVANKVRIIIELCAFLVVIISLIVAMYLCGYTFATWFAKYWGWVVAVLCVLVIGGITLTYWKIRRS